MKTSYLQILSEMNSTTIYSGKKGSASTEIATKPTTLQFLTTITIFLTDETPIVIIRRWENISTHTAKMITLYLLVPEKFWLENSVTPSTIVFGKKMKTSHPRII